MLRGLEQSLSEHQLAMANFKNTAVACPSRPPMQKKKKKKNPREEKAVQNKV